VNFTLSGSAQRDIDSAEAFYSRERRGPRNRQIAARFIEELDRALMLLRERPELGQRIGPDHRRFPLHGFPFFVNYRIDKANSLIRVVAISHQSRRPGYWANRVEELRATYAVAA
jgi:plasmid stabilization system protein ParE